MAAATTVDKTASGERMREVLAGFARLLARQAAREFLSGHSSQPSEKQDHGRH